ncbi:hypothetical protein SDC9_45954 [bioreactor metagenome]|uniref:Uncharacterized protein n=1 Tax=bioreactor metagenome TaxID=1076179 RepID=A0A644WBH3_9ZZZZ
MGGDRVFIILPGRRQHVGIELPVGVRQRVHGLARNSAQILLGLPTLVIDLRFVEPVHTDVVHGMALEGDQVAHLLHLFRGQVPLGADGLGNDEYGRFQLVFFQNGVSVREVIAVTVVKGDDDGLLFLRAGFHFIDEICGIAV